MESRSIPVFVIVIVVFGRAWTAARALTLASQQAGFFRGASKAGLSTCKIMSRSDLAGIQIGHKQTTSLSCTRE